jgi:hypothetical protein
MSSKVPIIPTEHCPDCGQGIALIITTDGVGWFHVGQFDASTNTQTVHELCPDGNEP